VGTGQGLGMQIGDSVTLKAIVKHDAGDGSYAVDIPSYPARFGVRLAKKTRVGAEIELTGEVAILIGERVTVQLEGGRRITVRADTVVPAAKQPKQPKLFDKRR
jgi:hypothetical protein